MFLTEEQYKEWSQCGFCDGRGHHPTRETLLCQACDGRGRVPWKAEPELGTKGGES
jgi:DnaJ-class molecular chaperone